MCMAVLAVAVVLLAGCSLGGDDDSSAFEDADFVVNLDDPPALGSTVVNVPLDVLRRGYMVLVHDVAAETRMSGICADLSRARPPGAARIFE